MTLNLSAGDAPAAAAPAGRPVGRTILAADAAHPRHSEASAAQLLDGALLLVWSEFEGTGDNHGSRIAGMISRDGGHTWGERRVLLENRAGLNVMSPALRRLPDGALGMLYSHRESTTSAARHFVRSDDDGLTWSPPLRLPQEEPYTTGCHDRLAVLDGGRLVAPLHCTADWHQHHLSVRCAWSDDHGQSWRLSPAVELPRVSDSGESGCIEPDVAQRKDGSLLMAIRTAMGTVFRAESRDGGESWTGLRSMEVVNPVAPALLRRIPGTGDLLLVWNWHYDWREPLAGLRRPLACAVSSDGGDSWPFFRRTVLEDDPSHTYAYPSCHFLGAGKDAVAFLTYHVSPAGERGAPFTHQRSLRTMHLPLRWLPA